MQESQPPQSGWPIDKNCPAQTPNKPGIAKGVGPQGLHNIRDRSLAGSNRPARSIAPRCANTRPPLGGGNPRPFRRGPICAALHFYMLAHFEPLEAPAFGGGPQQLYLSHRPWADGPDLPGTSAGLMMRPRAPPPPVVGVLILYDGRGQHDRRV